MKNKQIIAAILLLTAIAFAGCSKYKCTCTISSQSFDTETSDKKLAQTVCDNRIAGIKSIDSTATCILER